MIWVQAAKAWSREERRSGADLASGNMEKIGDLIVYRQEFLDLPWRFVPLHDPLSSPRRLMRILRPIVQPFVLAVLQVQAHVLARCAIGFELVRDHDARRFRGLLQQLPHKPLRGGSISSALNEDVENEAVLIDGAPEPMLLGGDCDDNLASRPGELHPQALPDPYVSLSAHTAPDVRL